MFLHRVRTGGRGVRCPRDGTRWKRGIRTGTTINTNDWVGGGGWGRGTGEGAGEGQFSRKAGVYRKFQYCLLL